MPDIFSISNDFYKHFPSPIPMSERRKVLLDKIQNVVKNAIFWSLEQKKSILILLPFFSDEVLEEFKNTIIRENLSYMLNKNKK